MGAEVLFEERALAIRWAVFALAKQGRSVASLARRCGISQPHMHQWLRCRREFSPRLLARVCDVLGIDLRAVEDAWRSD